jgi:DNA repair exonuclease SbcCD ATPase subunit
MRPLYLYLENFFCHDKSEIDFSSFQSALIVGKVDNNELIANGVGKTSIFRAIEYALFNQVRDPLLSKDIVLERLIRDEASKVSVIFDFAIGDEIFRVVRSRTRTPVSDLSFYRRNAVEGSAHTHLIDKRFWDDISSRRTPDTEADLAKKIRITYKAFMSTVHFMQWDMSGLATATPTNRKHILKEALGLSIYASLEKIAKERAALILKEIDRDKTILETIGNPKEEIKDLETKLKSAEPQIEEKNTALLAQYKERDELNALHTELSSKLSYLESTIASTLQKKQNLQREIAKLNSDIAGYTTKRKSSSTEATRLIGEVQQATEKKKALGVLDLTYLDAVKYQLSKLTQDIGFLSSSITTLKADLEELNIPLPADGRCKHCRQPLTTEHRRVCQEDINKQLQDKQQALTEAKKHLATCTKQQKDRQQELFSLEAQQVLFNRLASEITAQEKAIEEKKSHHQEFSDLINKFNTDLSLKQEELHATEAEIIGSSEQEIKDLKSGLEVNKRNTSVLIKKLEELTQERNQLTSQQAILQHSIEVKHKDLQRKTELSAKIAELETKYSIYPLIAQAYGTAGIPNLIIQNVLEDLQDEANKLLSQIRPGLQLSFSTEKTRSDGDLDETLQIDYFLNNKPRDYSQLSGAQRLCIAFSFKLGLSFLLAKTTGSQVKFLLLDEVDQSLDKASIDALADIIKTFQQDFTILVITHNDRLQKKFGTAILVEQSQDMISRAQVVNI